MVIPRALPVCAVRRTSMRAALGFLQPVHHAPYIVEYPHVVPSGHALVFGAHEN